MITPLMSEAEPRIKTDLEPKPLPCALDLPSLPGVLVLPLLALLLQVDQQVDSPSHAQFAMAEAT